MTAPTTAKSAIITPGTLSSEFKLTVLADLVAVLNADKVWTFLPPHWAAIVGTVVTSAYALSRGWAKQGSAGAR